jgi:serine/threonine protein kinase
LTPDAPAGLCPRCLLEAGLASQSPAGSDSPAAQPTIDHSESRRFVPPTPAELAPAFPQLQILELLGSGGMGAVYKARQPHLDRLVALKILPPQLAQDPAFEERFGREARALAKLNHPHIVTVYDFGETTAPPHVEPAASATGKLYYLLMEYVDGTNLRQVIQEGSLKPEEALAIVPQLCEALQYAHDRGVVHRDIKPENILLDRQGRVKIADFGLAKIAGQPPTGEAAVVGKAWTLTATGQVMGTPHYMAPEQLRGTHDVDHRADIYSLGVVFYEMLTGELPIGKFEPPSRKVQVDVRLDEVVLRALESNPERRYQQASEVKTDVETISHSSLSGRRNVGGEQHASIPDGPVFRRATWEGLFLSIVWAVIVTVMEVGHITKAAWYVNREWPYPFLDGLLNPSTTFGLLFVGCWVGWLAWWWYLLGKKPDSPRSWADFWGFWKRPDKGMRKGAWLAFVILLASYGVLLPWVAIWPESAAAQSAYGTFLLVLSPFYVMGVLRWAYKDRFRELWQAGRSARSSAAPSSASAHFRLLLACAIGMVLGGLMMAAGVAVGVYALLSAPIGSGGFWGWMGGALGCFLGGGGSLLGSWNSFRQFAGEGDLLGAPGRTWLDYLMWAYTLTGMGLAAAALAVFFQVEAITPTVQALLTLGGMMVFQGILFLVFRGLMRQPKEKQAE